jgi:flagellar basal body P-ring formation protein FlgA
MHKHKLTRYVVLPLLASCLFFSMKLSAQATDNAVVLCQSPHIVAASNVTVADVFCQGVSKTNASYVLAPTPVAGDKLVLTAAELNRVAQNFKLAWQAAAGAELIIVSDQIIISTDDMQKAIIADTKWAEFAADIDVALVNSPVWALKAADKIDLTVADLQIDGTKKTFSAHITATSDNKKLATQSVQGTWQEMATMPVLLDRTSANTTITADMLGEQRLPKASVAAGTILAKDDMLGMVAKRALPPQKPILATSLTAPVLIKRNDLVTLRYTKGQMQLETRARAMANGAKGEWIQLMNLSSKKLLEARVIGPQLAEIAMD